jgi:hypothetical protein
MNLADSSLTDLLEELRKSVRVRGSDADKRIRAAKRRLQRGIKMMVLAMYPDADARTVVRTIEQTTRSTIAILMHKYRHRESIAHQLVTSALKRSETKGDDL